MTAVSHWQAGKAAESEAVARDMDEDSDDDYYNHLVSLVL